MRRLAVALAFAAAASTLLPADAGAQVARADSAAVLLATAARFEQEGRAGVAEALYAHIATAYADTPAAVAARERLGVASVDRVEGSGRVELQVFSTTFGLWLGIAVPAASGADSEEAFGAGLLLGGPTGLLASRALLRRRSVSLGQARAISWGGIWGTWQGLGWSEVFDLGEEEICTQFGCYTADSPEENWTATVVGGLAGVATGAIIARNPVASGVASGAQMGSTWGSIWSALAAVAVGMEEGDDVLVTSLVAGNLGLFAGASLARRQGMSRSRVRLIDLGALVGGVAGLGIDLLIQPDADEAAAGIPLVTSVVGAGIAYGATRDRDRAPPPPGEDGAAGAALLHYGPSGLELSAPRPLPSLLPSLDVTGRRTWRPGLSLLLLSGRF